MTFSGSVLWGGPTSTDHSQQDMKPHLIIFALLVSGVFGAYAQPPSACCLDATCTYCEEVDVCQNSPIITASEATVGGTEVCGVNPFDPYDPFFTPCTSFSENNAIGGDCLPSCNDPAACNYDAQSPSDLDCVYAEECEDCAGECLNDVNNNDLCDCFETFGCTDSTACNFNLLADAEDSSCIYPDDCIDCEGFCLEDINDNGLCDCWEQQGCTDFMACNYEVGAELDDGSCIYPDPGFNCDGSCSDEDGDGICLLDEIYGCTDSTAVNYYPIFTEDDGGCVYASDFTEDCVTVCPGDLNGDGVVGAGDLVDFLTLYDVICIE